MTPFQVRALITLALIALAALIIVVDTDRSLDLLATTIVGAVIGYWLHAADPSPPSVR